jgi:hypothetical protein
VYPTALDGVMNIWAENDCGRHVYVALCRDCVLYGKKEVLLWAVYAWRSNLTRSDGGRLVENRPL